MGELTPGLRKRAELLTHTNWCAVLSCSYNCSCDYSATKKLFLDAADEIENLQLKVERLEEEIERLKPMVVDPWDE